MDPFDMPVKTEDDFINFLYALCDDLRDNPESWANPSLESFLNAIGSRLADECARRDRLIKGGHPWHDSGRPMTPEEHAELLNKEDPMWSRMAALFYIGKMHE